MTNSAAIGYAIMAAKNLQIDKETIKQLEREMYRLMDRVEEEKAEKVYQNFWEIPEKRRTGNIPGSELPL